MKVGEFINNFNIIKDGSEVILNLDDVIIKGDRFSESILKHYNDIIGSINIYPEDLYHNRDRVVIFINK